MIGVIAIMAILAAVITPNALHVLDRAAVRAEADTLHNFGEQTKLFLKTNGWSPGLKPAAPALAWNQDLGTFSDVSPLDILSNKRQIARSFIYEPGVFPPKRVLILSCMHAGLTLPTAGNLTTQALFDNVWMTADGSVPLPGTSWAGWANWRTMLNGNAGDYLVIERVNLAPVYSTDLQDLTITINNTNVAASTTVVSYDLVGTNGAVRLTGTIAVGTPRILSAATVAPQSPPRPKERLDLFHRVTAASPRILDYSYVLTASSSGKTFDFKDTTSWVPQP